MPAPSEPAPVSPDGPPVCAWCERGRPEVELFLTRACRVICGPCVELGRAEPDEREAEERAEEAKTLWTGPPRPEPEDPG